jgi:hypothetical protein
MQKSKWTSKWQNWITKNFVLPLLLCLQWLINEKFVNCGSSKEIWLCTSRTKPTKTMNVAYIDWCFNAKIKVDIKDGFSTKKILCACSFALFAVTDINFWRLVVNCSSSKEIWICQLRTKPTKTMNVQSLNV